MPLNVLVVEADDVLRETLCEVCHDFGHESDSVSSGEEAVERAREETYSLIFMDYKMLGMDGIEAAEKIREFDTETLIYLISGHDFSDRTEQLRLKGINGYVDKGLNFTKRIEKVLDKEEVEAYLAFCEKQGGPSSHKFKGSFAFQYLFQQGRIRPGDEIRALYVHGGDGCYLVTEEGKLQGLETEHSKLEGIFEPEDVLSREKAKDGWDLDKIWPKKE